MSKAGIIITETHEGDVQFAMTDDGWTKVYTCGRHTALMAALRIIIASTPLGVKEVVDHFKAELDEAERDKS